MWGWSIERTNPAAFHLYTVEYVNRSIDGEIGSGYTIRATHFYGTGADMVLIVGDTVYVGIARGQQGTDMFHLYALNT